MFLRKDNFQQGTKKFVFNITKRLLIYIFFDDFLLPLQKSAFQECRSLYLDRMWKNSPQRFNQIRG